MSFDIFVMCFRNGDAATFERALFEEIFGRGAIDPQLPFTSVTYGDGSAEIYGADESEDIEHLMFNHCGGDTFYSALYELADRSGSVVIWPVIGRQIAVTSKAIIEHLPADVESLGPAYVVSNGQELAACVFLDDQMPPPSG